MTMLILSLLHIVAGAFWAGVVLFAFAFLEPVVEALGPAGGAFMQKLMTGTRLQLVMPLVGMLTGLSGVVMYWIVSDHLAVAWITSAHGIAISVGALAGILAAMAGGMGKRLRARMLEIRAGLKGAAPDAGQQAEMQTLTAALRARSRAGALLILLSLCCMAAAHAL